MTAVIQKTEEPGRRCPIVCDQCIFYAFNGDRSGAYIGEGRCTHPQHPRRADPEDACTDFLCICSLQVAEP